MSKNKLPRPSGGIGHHTFYQLQTLSLTYITRHQGYNSFANNDSSVEEKTNRRPPSDSAPEELPHKP